MEVGVSWKYRVDVLEVSSLQIISSIQRHFLGLTWITVCSSFRSPTNYCMDLESKNITATGKYMTSLTDEIIHHIAREMQHRMPVTSEWVLSAVLFHHHVTLNKPLCRPCQRCEQLSHCWQHAKLQKSVRKQIQFMRSGVIIMHEERCCLGSLRAYAALRPIQAGIRAAKFLCSCCITTTVYPARSYSYMLTCHCKALLEWQSWGGLHISWPESGNSMVDQSKERGSAAQHRWGNSSMFSFHSGLLHEYSSYINYNFL